VRVNAVSLGVIKTPVHDAASYEGMGDLHPLGRVGAIGDVVDGILYLEQATFVTGETRHIDGGWAVGTDAARPSPTRRAGDETRTRDIQLGSNPLLFEIRLAENPVWIVRFEVLTSGLG
jgi:hypothetical protein